MCSMVTLADDNLMLHPQVNYKNIVKEMILNLHQSNVLIVNFMHQAL